MCAKPPDDYESPSFVSSLPRFSSPERNPITALRSLKEQLPSNVDWILCPGDLADRHDETCQNLAWTKLAQLRQHLHARHLFGTAGNHDVDSLRKNGTSLPMEALKALDPQFPHANASSNRLYDKYWTTGVALHKEVKKNTSLVLLNSCLYHGTESGPNLPENEWRRGRVSEEALQELRRVSRGLTTERNILLTHHHLSTHPDIDDANSVLQNGSQIMEILHTSGKNWMVVHGHLHAPYLYKSEGTSNIYVLSSGSAGGKPFNIRGRTPDNQCHLLRLAPSTPGSDMRVEIETWNWIDCTGWLPSSPDNGLPHRTGLGCSDGIDAISDDIYSTIQRAGEMHWKELIDAKPNLRFLSPQQSALLKEKLKHRNLDIHYDELQQFKVIRVNQEVL